MKKSLLITLLALIIACQPQQAENPVLDQAPEFTWENATIYFLLTDRFKNGNLENDINFGRQPDGAPLRNFLGGDFAGVTQKIEEGYFNDLGVDAIWFNPPVEQIHGSVDEGTGKTYGYHGYWARDWTALDPNFGSLEDLRKLVETAHAHNIRILMDVVINHTGPVTPQDSQWPDEWVRTGPQCTYTSAETAIKCTLVENLPDIKTEKDEEVELPQFLIDKWKEEGRLDQEQQELDDFFARTGYPRAPRFYIMKWLTDYVRELGIDGYRVDTAKHTEASIWNELYKLAKEAFEDWKSANPDAVLDDQEFFMVGEVYGYSIGHGLDYPYTENEKVNFFENGFRSLISFALKGDAGRNPEDVFSYYSSQLNGPLDGKTVLNYLSSHDDGGPFDRKREKNYLAANMLMLAPGQAQIYYGDEIARPLEVDGVGHDADLRTMMNWDDLKKEETQNILKHWQKLGRFRQEHPAVGAGVHRKLKDAPYTFQRTLTKDSVLVDAVIVVMDSDGAPVDLQGFFADEDKLTNYYTGEEAMVMNGMIVFEEPSDLLLIGKRF